MRTRRTPLSFPRPGSAAMTIRVAIHHRTLYKFDRAVGLSPHEIRLRPAPHCRTPVASYSLRVAPEKHFVNWQQDAYGNYIARFVFPEPARALDITVDLVADMTVINPFDFFVEHWAEQFPFDYPPQLAAELAPYFERETPGPLLERWLAEFRAHGPKPGGNMVDFLVDLNQRIAGRVKYLVRMEPGIQSPDQTLELGAGSCRDSGWLLVQVLRHLGLAARFVSGYLVQLVADVKPLDGPPGPTADFTDLHAWAEVYLPGAGWVGLDPTSGLLAGEGHIPLAATAFPSSAAPVTGFTDVCNSELAFEMEVTRIHEDPRVTRPYSDAQWAEIDALGRAIDRDLDARGVRLTQGGEPTFVSIDDMDGPEWNFTALSPKKWQLAEALAWRLRDRFAPGGLLFYGQGKWYPGEPVPRWALSLHWRRDGRPLWRAGELIDRGSTGESAAAGANIEHVAAFARALAHEFGLDSGYAIPAYEDPLPLLTIEAGLPDNVDVTKAPLKDYDDRARLRRTLERGMESPAAYVLPLRARPPELRPAGGPVTPATWPSEWESSPWPLRRERLFLLPGDSPAGYRLPLAALPERLPEEIEPEFVRDPFDPLGDLHDAHVRSEKKKHARPKGAPAPREVVRTALCIEPRGGRLHVFLPPVTHVEDWINLVAAIEHVAAALGRSVRMEGYPPPHDPRLRSLGVTPDPGVIEVNVHPSSSWDELVANTAALYEEARAMRLGTEKFMVDGRHTGTGGGNHMTLGGATPAESPFLRRPDVLKSLVTYWQNHPSLSYLFSGLFVGPTSQAPRVDEARDDQLYELEIAFQQMDERVRPGAESGFPVARRPAAAQPPRRPDRQHPPRRVLDRQALLARLAVRAARPGRAPRVRDAAAPPDGAGAGAARARARGPVLERALPREPRLLGDAAPRPLDAAALRPAGPPRRGDRPRCGRLRAARGVVRAVRRVPLSALRVGDLRGRDARAAPGDRALARPRRGDGRRSHGALRGFVGRTAAGEGERHDRRAARRHLQRPAGAARAHRRARRVRCRGALQGLVAARRPCTRRSGSRPRSCSTSSTAGAAGRSAAAPTTSRIRAVAITTLSRSTRTRPRRGASRASGVTATPPDR